VGDWFEARSARLQYPARGRSFPPLFINTVPKSGSAFFNDTITRALQIRQRRIGANVFPDDVVVLWFIDDFAKKNTLAQSHLPATPRNLALLSHHMDRLVIHVRDPRQATLSWTHHLNKVAEKDTLGRDHAIYDPIPEGYFEMSFSDQLSWQIDHHLPHVVRWIEAWVNVAENPKAPLKILMTTYEELKENSAALVRKILDFYEIEYQEKWLVIPPPEPGKAHFRKGDPQEWHRVTSSDQAERAWSHISPDLIERFGWER